MNSGTCLHPATFVSQASLFSHIVTAHDLLELFFGGVGFAFYGFKMEE